MAATRALGSCEVHCRRTLSLFLIGNGKKITIYVSPPHPPPDPHPSIGRVLQGDFLGQRGSAPWVGLAPPPHCLAKAWSDLAIPRRGEPIREWGWGPGRLAPGGGTRALGESAHAIVFSRHTDTFAAPPLCNEAPLTPRPRAAGGGTAALSGLFRNPCHVLLTVTIHTKRPSGQVVPQAVRGPTRLFGPVCRRATRTQVWGQSEY